MRLSKLNLLFGLVTLCLPLVLADCPKRTMLVPRNKEFLDLCGSEPNDTGSPKNDKHPCFRLEANNLHNVELQDFRPDHKELDESAMIVKDGDLTHFTPRDSSKAFLIIWNGSGSRFVYSPSDRPGCGEFSLYTGSEPRWRFVVKGEHGDMMDTDAYMPSPSVLICSKWFTIRLAQDAAYVPDDE
ncbi:uncharacterized protein UTRI_10154 [Ustilago trichophora]|uniref:Mig1 protein n=1 Tax=Ustilago trichophora TaxID=86804 RepID=A0A5C3EC32_9BASI|nr:uncharacterized protein UTRI_10154 [Ustilago trichophora]